MKLEKTGTTYAIAVPREKAAALFEGDTLLKALETITGVTCNYDGHFGPFVYVTIQIKYDVKATRDEILSAIRLGLHSRQSVKRG